VFGNASRSSASSIGPGDSGRPCSSVLPESVRYNLPFDADGGGVETFAMICSARDINGGSVAGGTSSILVLGGRKVSSEFFRRRLLRLLFFVSLVSTDSRLMEFCLTQLSALSLFLAAADFSFVLEEFELCWDLVEAVRRDARSLEPVKLGVRGAL
jgi:hypothetical protein